MSELDKKHAILGLEEMMQSVRIYEVTPRDGLQNEKQIVETSEKLKLIEKLMDAGYRDIEVTSFVKPSWIPQLADATELCRILPEPPPGVRYWALIPNRRGLEFSMDAGITAVATFMSASETHNRKNLNRTQRESLTNLAEVIGVAKEESMAVRAYISTVFGCPYEGDVPVSQSVKIATELLKMGADEIVLGDTTGMGVPNQVQDVVKAMVDANIPIDKLSLHLHDTRGTALANAYAGYLAGIRTFDGSTGGVGGCPYAPGASGNVASEDLVHMFHGMGCTTGVNLDMAANIGTQLSEMLKRELPGRYYRFHQGVKRRKRQSA